MFNPSQEDVRRYFCAAFAKSRDGLPLEPLEMIAAQWIAEHPHYHPDATEPTPLQAGNPFLHLSMHLSISEQCSIDQPRGIRQAVELLARRRDSVHDAHHAAMECLGTMLWESQRSGRPPDGEAYVACVQRQATRD